jgi:hypothetical protein
MQLGRHSGDAQVEAVGALSACAHSKALLRR